MHIYLGVLEINVRTTVLGRFVACVSLTSCQMSSILICSNCEIISISLLHSVYDRKINSPTHDMKWQICKQPQPSAETMFAFICFPFNYILEMSHSKSMGNAWHAVSRMICTWNVHECTRHKQDSDMMSLDPFQSHTSLRKTVKPMKPAHI